MGDYFAAALSSHVPDEVREPVSAVLSSCLQACLDDPTFEFSILVMTINSPSGLWPGGEPRARYWTGKSGVVRNAKVPPGIPLNTVAAARPATASWNMIWWLYGLKHDGSGIVTRILADHIDDPMQPLEDGQWALGLIAAFDRDLAARAREG